jgi:hypothetical protein
MSWDIGVFVKTTVSFEEFVSSMEQLLSVSFLIKKQKEWPIAYFSGLGLTIRLIGDLDYDDDMGIDFSNYTYQIDVDMYPRVKEEEYCIQLRYYMAMYIYSRICEKLAWKCMVVEEMQKLLARN